VAPQQDQLPDHCGIKATIHPVSLAVESIGWSSNHALETVRLISLIVQSLHYATIILAHVIVNGSLQRVVVVDHARLRVIYSDRKVTGRVARVEQPGRSMIVEARY
jgi:hypothetical protein